MSATMGNAEIILKSKDVDRLLIGPHSLFYGKRMLTTDAEEFIIEEAEKYSSRTTIYLKVYLPPDNLNRSQVVDSAIRQHFAYRKTRSLKQLSHTLKLGWKGLLIAIIFLSVLVLFTLIIIRQIPEGSLSVIFREVLIILGWVALWRPADLLLYEWRQFKRDANLFERLEHCKIEVITEEM